MELFRIAHKKYAGSLTSSGAANRWNVSGQYVIYAGASRSLSTLELVVHRSSINPIGTYKVMLISVADDDRLVSQIQIGDLPSDWRTMAAYPILQQVGGDWYNSKETLLLKIPSVVIIQEYNYLINTKHPDFLKLVKLVRTEDYFFDPRLW
jgi:RES domain-containing protein